jgi:beta-glucosidase
MEGSGQHEATETRFFTKAFESFSEDPFLSGMLAAAYINGLQESGVGAVIKHFGECFFFRRMSSHLSGFIVCNDMEHERFSVSIEVAERGQFTSAFWR